MRNLVNLEKEVKEVIKDIKRDAKDLGNELSDYPLYETLIILEKQLKELVDEITDRDFKKGGK